MGEVHDDRRKGPGGGVAGNSFAMPRRCAERSSAGTESWPVLCVPTTVTLDAPSRSYRVMNVGGFRGSVVSHFVTSPARVEGILVP